MLIIQMKVVMVFLFMIRMANIIKHNHFNTYFSSLCHVFNQNKYVLHKETKNPRQSYFRCVDVFLFFTFFVHYLNTHSETFTQ